MKVSNIQYYLSNSSSKKVMIVGQNSNYVFFVEKGQKEITASPINGTIRTILKRD